MKKRMFLTTALMALVLLVAVTTATFAWYTAIEGDTAVQGIAATVDASNADFTAGGVTVKFALSNPTEGVGPTDQNGNIYYITGNGTLVKAPDNTYTKEGTVTWTVSIDYDSSKMDYKEAASIVKGTYTVKVSGTNLRLAEGEAGDAIKVGDASHVEIQFTISVDEEGTVSIISTNNNSHTGELYFAVDKTLTKAAESATAPTLTITPVFTVNPLED